MLVICTTCDFLFNSGHRSVAKFYIVPDHEGTSDQALVYIKWAFALCEINLGSTLNKKRSTQSQGLGNDFLTFLCIP